MEEHFKQNGEFQFELLPAVISQDIEKPQRRFRPMVNNSMSVFIPHLKEKHNAKKEWSSEHFDIHHSMFLMEDYARQIGVDMQNSELRAHISPYSYEVNRRIWEG